MPASRRLRVDTVGQLGRADTKDAANPDRATPDSLGLPDGAEKFEAVPFDQVAGGPGNANAGHGGHGKNSGAVNLSDKAAARGHHEVNFASVRGHGVAKRGPGKTTPTDEETRRKLSTAGS
jgi:hypothetical protein